MLVNWHNNQVWWSIRQNQTQSDFCTVSWCREWVTYKFRERQSHHILSYDQQQVSDIAHLVKGSLTISFPMTNRMWVTLHILWKSVSSHLFLWPTGCEWHYTFFESQSHHIFSYDQQDVSDIAHYVKGSLITSFPMTNRMWATLLVKGSLVTSFPMTNRRWVTLYILWKAVLSHIFLTNSEWVMLRILQRAASSHLFLSPTASEWHFTFCKRQCHHIFSYHNRLWVTLHILWKAVSSHLFLWPTGSEWHCTFCERQSHHIFSYDQ